jgi:hypothetical protein
MRDWELERRASISNLFFCKKFRASATRNGEPQMLPRGGIIGSAVLRGVPPDIRTVLPAGSVAHVGKAAVFRHGRVKVENV